MTCLERYLENHPGKSVEEIYRQHCPDTQSIMEEPEYCTGCFDDGLCEKCWNREVPGTEKKSVLQAAMEKLQPDVTKKFTESLKSVASAIKDSGERRQFDTGAVRDIQEGKGRCDLMPLDVVADYYHKAFGDDSSTWKTIRPMSQFMETGDPHWLIIALVMFVDESDFTSHSDMFLEVAIHFEEGAKKYGENNWQKGIPVRCYINSAVRHYLKWVRGDKDEPHDRAFCWNILCAIWTCKHKPELNEYAGKVGDQ